VASCGGGAVPKGGAKLKGPWHRGRQAQVPVVLVLNLIG
jgi:hypothetical protein